MRSARSTDARRGWPAVATAAGVPLRVIEVGVGDPVEHRRRVQQRRSDLDGLTVPTWEQVMTRGYQPWDEHRDGPRLIVHDDDTPETAVATIRA